MNFINQLRSTAKPYLNAYGFVLVLLSGLQVLAPLLRSAGIGVSIPGITDGMLLTAIACLLV